MSIFNPSSLGNAVQQAIAIRQLSRQSALQLKINYLNAYNAVWNSNIPAEKVVEAMGVDAVQLFTVAAATAQLLTLCGVNDIPTTMPSGWNFVANSDGSVVITKKVGT